VIRREDRDFSLQSAETGCRAHPAVDPVGTGGSSAEVKNAWSYTSTSPHSHDVVLIYAQKELCTLIFRAGGRLFL
jgi:hypothetical protein